MGMAAKLYSRPVDAFTICFPDDVHNEEAVAADTAQLCGAQLHKVFITEDTVADVLEEAVCHCDEIPRSEYVVGKYLLHRDMLRTAVAASDERNDILQSVEQEYDVLPFQESRVRRNDLRVPERLLGFVPSIFEGSSALGADIHSVLGQEFVTRFGVRDSYSLLMNQFDFSNQLEGRETLTQSLYIWQKTILPNHFLVGGADRSEKLVQDTLRGPTLRDNPFFNSSAVLSLLDRVPEMTAPERRRWQKVFLTVLGSCFLQKRYDVSFS
jgi:asparagine synthase (glutamine-hydrolysing)